MKSLLVVVLVAVASLTACTHAPPTLSPTATREFNNMRVIKAIDLVRDVAITANKQTPPLLSARATKKVVVFHESAVRIIDASGAGRQAALLKLVDELKVDVDLLPAEVARIRPYLDLVTVLIQEAVPAARYILLPELEVV